MKTTMFATAAVFAAMTAAAPAQADDLRWQGGLFITAVTTGCAPASGGIQAQVGDQWTWVFRDADGVQTMAIFGQRRAQSFAPQAGGAFGKAGDYAGTFIGSNAIGRQGEGKYSAFKTTPGKITVDVRTLTLSGKIAGFDGTVGCDVTFEAAGIRRPGY